ncbi:recombinase family protein [Amycolatopsis sp. GM8]|uniref:recombinase family protein n=1 Tax=Amycolatopsis sp. GM8 TaxID=2896530 RepID=UPI001F31D19B
MAQWRYHEQLGFDTIAERLNADLEAHPPPEPPGGRRARGAWSKSAVADVLKNPKYTEYQVYNRRARRSRGGTGVVNPPEMWVWSVEPAHEPLIPKWMYDELVARRLAKRGSRDGSEANPHPNTKRVYVLRGRVVCRCGRRMLGQHHRGHNYYRCWPKNNNRGRLDKFTDHPQIMYMREDAILVAVNQVYAEYLFGDRRMELLAPQLDQVDDREHRDRAERRVRLEKRAAELARKQSNVLSQAEDADPNDPFTQGLSERYNSLGVEHRLVLDQITELDHHDQRSPAVATREDLDLVNLLPHLAVNLHRAPVELQARLYELSKLHVSVDHETDHAMIDITLPSDRIDGIAQTAAEASDDAKVVRLEKHQVKHGVIAASAPGAARTASTRNRTRRELLVSATVDVVRRRRRSGGGAQ